MPHTDSRELADWRAFIGPKADYYLSQQLAFDDGVGKLKFNWAAFFVSLAWMLYRRMYRRTLFLFAVVEATELLLYFGLRAVVARHGVLTNAHLWSVLDRGIGLALAVACGMLGNGWYLTHVRQQLAALPSGNEGTAAHAHAVGDAGGVSLLHAIVGVLLLGGGSTLLEYALKIPN